MASLARTTPARHPSPEPQASTTSCWPATPATNASQTPATSGPSPASPPAPAHESSTTSDEPPATPTDAPSEHSRTAGSASSMAASATAPYTTNTPLGTTEPQSLLDTYDPWDV